MNIKTLFLALTLLTVFSATSQNINEQLLSSVIDNDTTSIIIHINNGASVNYIKEEKWVKINLLITAVNKNNIDAARVLIKNQADVNWKDGFNTTALMYAAANGNINMVKLLINNEANINYKDPNGNDAISSAKEGNHKEIIKLLKGFK